MLSAVGLVIGMVLVALVVGAVSLMLYIRSQAVQRAANLRQVQLIQQAEIVQKAQEAEATTRRDELLRQLREARRELTDSHPRVVALRAEIAALDAAATTNAASTTILRHRRLADTATP